MQLLQDLVHGLLLVLQLLELSELGAGSRCTSGEAGVGARGRVEEGSVLRRTNRLRGPGPAHFPGERQALCLTTVVRDSLGLWATNNGL